MPNSFHIHLHFFNWKPNFNWKHFIETDLLSITHCQLVKNKLHTTSTVKSLSFMCIRICGVWKKMHKNICNLPISMFIHKVNRFKYQQKCSYSVNCKILCPRKCIISQLMKDLSKRTKCINAYNVIQCLGNNIITTCVTLCPKGFSEKKS